MSEFPAMANLMLWLAHKKMRKALVEFCLPMTGTMVQITNFITSQLKGTGATAKL
jgi:hypothetical protein